MDNKLLTKNKSIIVCIHEDRASHFIGLQLSILSLKKHSPELKISVSCPKATPDQLRWIKEQGDIKVLEFETRKDIGWNIKPNLLLHLLESGYEQAIWLDSDIIVNGNILSRLAQLDLNTFAAAEEPYWGQEQGNDLRTRAWGLKPYRVFSATINSGLIRATQCHIDIIKAWKEMLNHPLYLESQKIRGMARPLHMIGDQEVLTALLGATNFKDTPVHLIKRGINIAQCFGAGGYTVAERLSNFIKGRSPELFHAMGNKPWTKPPRAPSIISGPGNIPQRIRAYYEYVMLECTPYNVIAKMHIQSISNNKDWLNKNLFISRLICFFGFNNASLTGLPLAIIDSFGKGLRRALKISRFAIDERFVIKEPPIT